MNWRGSLLKFCSVTGMPMLEPFVRLAAGEDVKEQMIGIAKFVVLPVIAMLAFIGMWSAAARTIVSDSVQLPGPMATWTAGVELFAMHTDQRIADRQAKQAKTAEAIDDLAKARGFETLAAQSGGDLSDRYTAAAVLHRKSALLAANFTPTSAPTFVDQILNSLVTVAFGFLLATAVAIPLGVMCGMSPWFNAAMTPFIQVFKPVSPLAWLPIAAVVIIWAYSDTDPNDAFFSKAFLTSAATVSLCSLWPTLVNTTFGVASVDKDYLNVARVLKLSWSQKLFKIILPASLPLMFAGLRISLGVGWMVLIAADMLAQNPGLGKFVWDTYQNGSSVSYARITFSVVVIGVIGLVFDRVMICLRNLVSFGDTAPS
ncbi:Bicarbonate transport system permease protein CmpB [Rubripirellula lacrimiformis]|uniref:Bicarbonate transport system permease protein CmpB n=1 Tax=Rubripirellula lacrimiformis TaxID=1930273 RepID=A0A517NLL5_9BACT|nr:ABC transporter permease [Rubripirellula lacrimiformis]QDT08026.1 Bicarbonate transport system permease protein CmpB [Rubripirellula lacrimiformis]